MGGFNVFTCVIARGGGSEDHLAIPIESIQGPFIMLKPNPENTQGHQETHRFFGTSGKMNCYDHDSGWPSTCEIFIQYTLKFQLSSWLNTCLVTDCFTKRSCDPGMYPQSI
jgi:hypothetical protein